MRKAVIGGWKNYIDIGLKLELVVAYHIGFVVNVVALLLWQKLQENKHVAFWMEKETKHVRF